MIGPLHTDLAGLAAAFGHAAARLAAHDATVDVLLAELALGRTARARAHLRADNVEPRVAARYCAWTGDVAPILAIWPSLREHVRSDLRVTNAPGRGRVCAELERVASDVGDAQLAAELHRCARDAGTPLPPIENEDARLVLDTIHAVIGAEPDAVRGRLRLRPRLPRGARRLGAPAIRFGDGEISLLVERSDTLLRLTVGQPAGALPYTVLLEPWIDAEPTGARVDGQPAQLDTRTLDDGRILQVQLVLEQARILEIDFAH